MPQHIHVKAKCHVFSRYKIHKKILPKIILIKVQKPQTKKYKNQNETPNEISKFLAAISD